jgi:small GTP-binding protein
MDLREYEQHKFEIADVLRQTSLMSSDPRKWREQTSDLFARLADDRFNLVVVGRFSRGKTSLMNALLGTDRLPTGIVPLTSVITTVAYGSAERAILRFERRFMDQEISLDALPQYVTQQGNPGNIKGIKEAEVQLPANFLRRGFHFVDTPGLGSAIEENTRTTESFLPEADAFLLVTSYESPLSDEEMRFFRSAASSPRRIFVVLNKQDTVREQERADALAYVRKELDAMFGPARPKVFSISARDGLEAKQSHDSRRLAASGIPALEQELVSFLLTQKQSEFLLRICDRVAELTRALPSSDRAAGLVEEIAALSGRIAGRIPAALRSGLVEETAARAPTSAQLRPCEICESISSALWEFERRFQYEIVVSREARRDLAERGGLCSFHTWQYESIASPQGICEGYSAVLEEWAAWMHAAAAGAQPDDVVAKLWARLPNGTSCPLCRVRSKAESDAITALVRRFANHEAQSLSRLSALCLPHFAALTTAMKNTSVTLDLMQRQASLLDRLAEDMKRYALKRDGIRSALLSDEEAAASKRGLSLVARARSIADRVG